MKSKEFLSELRMIIREEVSYAVRQELKNVLTESVLPKVTHEVRKPVQQTTAPRAVKKPLFKDPVLNELLSSTQPLINEHNAGVEFEEWPTMQHGGNVFMRNAPINAAPSGMNIKAIEQTSPELAAAFTRDYRDLVKAFDKKKAKS